MSKKKNIEKDPSLEGFETALTKSEQFIEDNQKTLTYVALGALIIVSLYLSFQKFIIEPKESEANENMFVAEQYFARDSFNLALNGDGNYFGFIDISSDFKMTKSANLAKYYTGICYLQLGEYEEAISHLKKFSTSDIMISAVATGAIGDAYCELGEFSSAISYYEKAANNNPNSFASPIYLSKAGQLHEEEGNYKKALRLYEIIKADYPKSQEGRNIEKMIARAKLQLEK
ncbi:MAG: tetratricopeptide repeat protein [Salinivirgaceae bacterium]|jgi:tetratricopeptide (TPR) repeat protein|nr:tetratricopeptide repeat protein [Salinivirgaceae bacterium]